ncbi:hypothetical protein PCANC_00928 [Puccinia coronata f. sp. avenae]|uniref:Ecp2 effector protein domain-containing protein n=1 Tax=Puccinia coronata f. sp. avenae TaxID=200324 RepID=A0A2N5W6E7_9BASI|nr:hypothetical protein PCASD_06525 [Puccinia coronata f. sp. avenae]PLW49849.1 hypothetical protein PCASD_01527 [Puccinia coronata f. sp. avenae]PLW57819.1 hypothetical protein PCANC_00928 [Puccinia coronata f. sp. avenae]
MFLRMAHLVIALFVLASTPSNADSLSPRADQAMPHGISLKSIIDESSSQLVQQYVLGDPTAIHKTYVQVFRSSTQSISSSLAKRNSTPTSPLNDGRHIDLTPSECTSQVCYSGSFEKPNKTDCDTIVAAQLYNSTGSLTAFPGTYVLVYSGTCVVAFQHPMGKPEYNYTFDYNWASLGKIMVQLMKKCMSQPEAQSIGGACKIDHYLKWTFENVLISLQRYIEPEKK